MMLDCYLWSSKLLLPEAFDHHEGWDLVTLLLRDLESLGLVLGLDLTSSGPCVVEKWVHTQMK